LGRVAQVGATASLRDDAYFRKSCAQVIAAREAMTRALVKLGFVVLPSSANFVFASHPQRSGMELAAALRDRAVLVRHFNKPRTLSAHHRRDGRRSPTADRGGGGYPWGMNSGLAH
jgi:histidinol-phosphate aminotransferase